jgi:3-oxoacyl-[acyl-carrier-protein] synthase II
MEKRRVVVTGLGAITPIGLSVSKFWSAAMEGTSGIETIKAFDISASKVKLAAEVKGFDPVTILGRKNASRMDRYTQLGMAAAQQAFDDAGLKVINLDPWRFGIVAGTGVGGYNTLFEESTKLLLGGMNQVSPLMVPKALPNILSGNLAIAFGAKAGVSSVVTACAAGTDAIGSAYRLIAWGEADVIIAGAADACINPLMLAGFTNLNALNASNDPLRASIPFDLERSGFVMGEGAGMLILESLEHALSRGARIYAEVAGYGTSCDAYHLVSPNPDCIASAMAMKKALQDAGLQTQDIAHINAHGTSTPLNDKLETQSIKSVFGDYAYKIPIASTKSMIGHLLGAAGAVEAIAAIKTLETGIIHPTIGLRHKDPDCDLDYIPEGKRALNGEAVLSNSFGFGGHNASLIFKKYHR